MEENRKEKQERNYFELFFMNYPIPMWIYDLDTLKFLEVNNAAVTKYGYTREEFSTMTLKDIRPVEDIKLLLDDIQKSRPEFQESGIWRHKLKNGEIIFADITSHTISYKGHNAVLVLANDVTKKIQTEEDLKKSEERYRFLTELVSDYAYSFKVLPDKTLKGEWITSAFNKVFGVTIPEIDAAGGWITMVHPEDLEIALAHAMKVANGQRDICEMRWVTKSGEIRWLRDYAIPVWDEEHKNVIRIYGASQDITAQKLAEENIKQINSLLLVIRNINQLIVSEKNPEQLIKKTCKLLREFKNFASVWIVLLDEKKNIINTAVDGLEKEFYDFLEKIQEHNLIGHILNTVNKDLFDIQNIFKNFNFKDDNYYNITAKIQHNENVYGFLIINLKQKITNQQEISLIKEVVDDIGLALYLIEEEKHKEIMENTIRESEKKYRDVVENASEIIYTTDINGYFQYVNPAGLKKSGYTLEELRKYKYIDLTLPEYRDRVKRHYFKQYIDKIPNTQIEFPFYTKDGKILWFEQTSSLLIENNNVIGFQLIARDITEKKLFEQKLIESEELFRNLVENISDVFYISDANGKMQYCSPNLYTETGYTPEEVIGRSYVRLIAPEDRRTVVDHYLKQTEIGARDVQIEFRVMKKDGGLLWVDQRTRIMRDSYGKVLGYRNVIRNITERKMLEEQITNERAYFKQLFDSSPTSIVIIDLNDIVIDANPAFIKNFEYKIEELRGKVLSELIVPHNLLNESNEINNYIRTGVLYNKQVIRRTKSGAFKHFLLSASPIFLKNKIVGAYGMYVDITDQVSAQETIKTSEEHLRNILENVQDAIFTISNKGILTSINPAFTKLTNWRIDQWLGKSLTDLVHPEDISTAIQLFNDALQGTPTTLCELRIKKQDGNYLISEFQIAPQIKDKKIIGVLGIARDITDRKILEQNIRQTQKLESLGTLAAGIAHDFNNILGIMIGHASLLESMLPQNEMVKKNTDAIIKAGMRAADLVKQILTFARKSDVKKEPIDLNIILKEITKMLSETFPKTISINLKLDKNLRMAPVDITQLHQVIINICVNARDAMPKGGTLTIATENVNGIDLQKVFPQAIAQPYVTIKISDTGIGIPKENLEHIFEPFFTTKERGKGTGMGLAVVRGIIDSHDGIISVESEPNVGTTFSIYLPALVKFEKQKSEEIQIEEIKGGNETILVVEDEELLLSLVSSYLNEKGYNVITASNSEEALKIYQNYFDKIHLVLSDYGLPKYDGLELFKKLKTINPDVKMIIASGFVDPQTKSEILKLGIKEFVQKPYHQIQILKTIRSILDFKKI